MAVSWENLRAGCSEMRLEDYLKMKGNRKEVSCPG